MSELTKTGPWQLRFLVVNDETGLLLFLTSNGVGKVATIEPKNLNEPARQIWYAIPVEGKKDWYTIIQDPGVIRPPGLARIPVEGSNDLKVILAKQPDEWRLEIVFINTATEPSFGDVYKIFPSIPPPVIGIYYLLGKEGDEAAIQTLPVTVDPNEPFPAWRFLLPR